MLPLSACQAKKTKGPRKLQDPHVDREIPNPLTKT
jgi:hypothetical protein